MNTDKNNGENTKEYKPEIVKAPHYFLVHFEETFTSIRERGEHGKAYTFFCDGFAVNVYGLSEEEAKTFDRFKLRSMLIGSREQKILWDAPSETILMQEINADERIKSGVWRLNRSPFIASGLVIENLPECERMHRNEKTEGLLCGKPQNEYNDGCFGGCVLQGYDQEEGMPNFKCPVLKMRRERWEKNHKKVA